MHNHINTTKVSGAPQKTTQCENNSDSSMLKSKGNVNGTSRYIGLENMCFVMKMSRSWYVPVMHASTWKFKSNDGMTLRYLTWCFASSSKIKDKALRLSENFKTLMHYSFLMKLSA